MPSAQRVAAPGFIGVQPTHKATQSARQISIRVCLLHSSKRCSTRTRHRCEHVTAALRLPKGVHDRTLLLANNVVVPAPRLRIDGFYRYEKEEVCKLGSSDCLDCVVPPTVPKTLNVDKSCFSTNESPKCKHKENYSVAANQTEFLHGANGRWCRVELRDFVRFHQLPIATSRWIKLNNIISVEW